MADRFTLNLGNGINRATLVNDFIDNRLLIQSGAQADSITTDRVFADIIDIETAAGVDTVQLLNHTQSNELIVETGADADTVKFEQYGPFGGTVSVDTQDGDDQIIANNSLFNSNVDFVTGLGNDQVSILNSDIAGHLRVETASGDDIVDLTDVQLATNRDVTILTGDDEDIVRLNNVVADELFADLGRDRDDFRLRDSTFRIATIDGGENTDRFFDLLGNHITNLSVVNFEQFF